MKEIDPREQNELDTLHPKVINRSAVLLLIVGGLFGLLLLRILLLQTAGYDRYQQ